jgi:hypothetical protein
MNQRQPFEVLGQISAAGDTKFWAVQPLYRFHAKPSNYVEYPNGYHINFSMSNASCTFMKRLALYKIRQHKFL